MYKTSIFYSVNLIQCIVRYGMYKYEFEHKNERTDNSFCYSGFAWKINVDMAIKLHEK